MSEERLNLAIFLVGFVLFAFLCALVGDTIKLEGFARAVIGGVTGFGALAALLVFCLKGRAYQMKKIHRAERKYGWLGFIGFLGFLGMRAFELHDPLFLVYFCLFFLFGLFGLFKKKLWYLGMLGLLGVLLPTLYIIGLLAV